jgi:hypothetical protein
MNPFGSLTEGGFFNGFIRLFPFRVDRGNGVAGRLEQ